MSSSNEESSAIESSPPESGETEGYATAPSTTSGLPGGIPFIIGNEAAERFSFYGMKSILTIFMTDYLHWMTTAPAGGGMNKAEAIEHYHTFTASAYFFPILGALVADIFLGKYRTILYLSIVYCIGHAALAFMGSPGTSAGMWLFAGLLLIAIGSGGIKPCVSAHVGDQFGRGNHHLLTKVYQWFYFSINFGAFMSTLLTPWLLEHYGPHWAFGVPGVLMALATFLFWLGRNRFVHIPAGGVQFLRETFSWTGVSAILKLSIIFSFVAVFWALFDQTGSSWVLQAKNLDRNWMGVQWLESQIQAINPILILTLIPVFQFLIYPQVNRVFTLTPIRKISIGLFIMTGGFAIVAALQELIDAGQEPSIAWQFLAYGVLTASEVMVSITCLEFAYTQSPKSMKSMVMAVFLLSVFVGNLFTAVVNRFIQTPTVTALVGEGIDADVLASGKIEDKLFPAEVLDAADGEEGKRLVVLGPDGESGTDDDVVLSLDKDGMLVSVQNESEQAFEELADQIEAVFFAQTDSDEASLPSVDAIGDIVKDATDAHGNPITYKLVTRDSYQLFSAGADKVEGTRWDETLTVSLARAQSTEDAAGDSGKPYFNWLERQKIKLLSEGDAAKADEVRLELVEARDGGATTTFSRDYTIGGRLLLEGASYFWFWTKCIFITAILFVPVGYFYREKTYIQDAV
ncbi:proton-dependent oligopeptide transporter, POT family [Neorhodopirellula lusitana]|uniref:Proton-dependent oligopeptide transporter, POT family n=1 Tax=Neorhodopirellula lusitana TaxID=445327 RepID=A0ABY1Q191_9BACT|nr:MFS transporter [Neorhodopirellula lusitana]SMP56121.1 proton-dependent oligopeptide transporter, POT family [Neorhodopirellula lusitana]